MANIETFKYWCHKVLPLVYDDSLSYYELLCKVVSKLNEIVENENNLTEVVGELKSYVDNYFTSTDFTEKVNNRLDEMVADGTFDNLFDKFRYHNYITYPYHNVYLNRITGDDNNDGLSQATAFKTLDRALKEANNYGDFRIWIYGSGEYDWNEPTLNGVTLHIIDKVGDVKINCVPSKQVAMSIYNSHINIAGYNESKPIELYVPQTFKDFTNQVVYFENCATALKNVFFNSAYRLNTFGGYIRFEGKFKTTGQVVLRSTVGTSSANFEVLNTSASLYPIGVLYGATFTVNGGTWSWASLSSTPTSNINACIHIDSSTFIANKNISPSSITNKYYYSISATHSIILFANARYNLFNNNLSLNGPYIKHSTVNGELVNPDP